MNGAHSGRIHPDDATLGAFHDGELHGFARADVEAHVEDCSRCRGELNDLASVTDALRSLPIVEPSPQTWHKLSAQLSGTRIHTGRHRQRWIIATAAVVVAAVAGWFDVFVIPHGSLAPTAAELPSVGSRHAPSKQPSHATASSYAQADRAPLSANPAPATGAVGTGGSTFRRTPKRVLVGPGMTQTALPPAASLARLIVRTAEVNLEVPDVRKAFVAVTALATREQGYVADSNNAVSTTTDRGPAAALTLRVPATNFQRTLDFLASLPNHKLTERSGSQDISDSYRDLQAGLQALKATRSQLMSLMRRARNIGEAMTVLDRLTEVNTNIDSLQSQILSSDNSVMLSTITVNLTPEPRKQAVTLPARRRRPPGWQPRRELSAAWANVVHALQAMATIVIYAVVYLALPAMLAALVLAARRLRRWAAGNARAP